MNATLNTGRLIALLLLAQMAGGFVVNFVLLSAATATPPGFLVAAVAHATELRVAAVLGLVTGAMTLAIAITGWPLFRAHSRALAQWLFALGIVNLVLEFVEQATVLSLLSLSQAAADASDATTFQTLATVVGAARRWAHYTKLIAAGSSMFVLYALLLRFALVPRLLAAFGVAAFALQIVTVTLPLFGAPIFFQLLAPAGLAHLALVLWLLVKGFRERPPVSAHAT